MNGTELHVETLGSGPPLLAMHGGLGLDHTYLRPAHDQLARDHHVIYYDHRGNGRSARDVGATDHATWHADADALLDVLGHDEAIVYGHSYGAWLALGFALAYPERVSALVLCGAAPCFDYGPEVMARVQAGAPDLAAAFVAAVTSPAPSDAAFGDAWHRILPLYFVGAPRRELFATTEFSAEGYGLGSAGMATYDVRAELEALAVPTLLVVGTHDFITPPAQARRIAARAPACQVVELPGAGHFPFAEAPAAYLEHVAGWLAGLRRRQGPRPTDRAAGRRASRARPRRRRATGAGGAPPPPRRRSR